MQSNILGYTNNMSRNRNYKAFSLGLVIIFLISYYFVKALAKYYFFASHDGDYQLIRTLLAVNIFKEGQFPLRWAGSLNNFCGAPIFNFLYPLFYYLTASIQLATHWDFTLVVIRMYMVIFMLIPFGMYLWLYFETKRFWPSLTGGLLYLLSSYNFVNLYVRGSVELLAYALLPLVLLTTSLSFKYSKNIAFFILASLIGAMFALSHNLVVFMFIPFLAFFIFIKARQTKNYRHALLLPLFWVGLSAFFWFPALLEAKYVKLGSQVAADYRYHFLSLKQLFYSPWGFFYEQAHVLYEAPTGMNLGIGPSHWLIIVAGLAFLFYPKQKNKKSILFLLGLTLITIFFMSHFSSPIWGLIKPLHQIQYPWRLAGIVVFLTSLLSAYLVFSLPNKSLEIILSLIFISFAFYTNRNHHIPTPLMDDSFYHNLEYHPFRHATTTIADEVLSTDSPSICLYDPLVQGKFIQGSSGEFHETYGRGSFSSSRETTQDLVLKLEYFPKIYKIRINDHDYPYESAKGRLLIKSVQIQKGLNQLDWHIVSSPTEKFSNYLSLIALLALILSPLYLFSRPKHQS